MCLVSKQKHLQQSVLGIKVAGVETSLTTQLRIASLLMSDGATCEFCAYVFALEATTTQQQQQ